MLRWTIDWRTLAGRAEDHPRENVLLPSGKEHRIQENREKSLVAGNIFYIKTQYI